LGNRHHCNQSSDASDLLGQPAMPTSPCRARSPRWSGRSSTPLLRSECAPFRRRDSPALAQNRSQVFAAST
jgi:hypothetical protein